MAQRGFDASKKFILTARRQFLGGRRRQLMPWNLVDPDQWAGLLERVEPSPQLGLLLLNRKRAYLEFSSAKIP